ncbi:hypothetical protein [Caulobacter phage Cr30]|nr:hypothetical protein OZ74_gp053 [Caulobacter phage Cr30]AGS80938.1 hypothetical protein [Caulobacter phage Cr30]
MNCIDVEYFRNVYVSSMTICAFACTGIGFLVATYINRKN